MLDKNSKKVLKFFIKNNDTNSFAAISSHFSKYSHLDLIDILNHLHKEGYLRIIGDSKYYLTNKGKTYKNLSTKLWLSEHIVETSALIISILAFIEATIALFLK